MHKNIIGSKTCHDPIFYTVWSWQNHHTLKPYMAPVNHNIINETAWIKIAHTLLGNFCLESDDKNDMNALENMGNDACVIVGYHKKASEFMKSVGHFPNWKCRLTNKEYILMQF